MIKRNRYKKITDELSFVIRANDGILESVNQIQADLASLIDLLDEDLTFENNTDAFVLSEIDAAADEYESDIVKKRTESLSMDKITTALQEHIEEHYEEINAYLANNTLRLREEFANVSTTLSFPIDASNYKYITLDNEGLYKASSNVTLSFSADPLETATVRINEEDFILQKNSTGQFVWDFGGAGQHTFTSVGETSSRTAGSQSFDITYQGSPGILFDIDFT
jgi:hypothetical protein